MDGEDQRSRSERCDAQREPSFWVCHKWETLVLLLLPILLYLSTVTFGYVLDDKIAVEENQFVHEGIRGIGKIFGSESLVGYIGQHPGVVAGSRYRPLSLASFAIEYELYGLDPGLSHLVNVLLYAISCVVLFRLFSLLLRNGADRAWYFRLPFLAAVLFALHPLHSEVVANIKGRDEILALLFSLATLLLTLRYVRDGGLRALIFAGSTFLLALLAKENSITFLAVVPLTLFFFTQARARTLAIAMVPLALATACYLLMRQHAVGSLLAGSAESITELMNNPFVEASFSQKYGTILYTWGLYLKLLIFPHPLTHDYYPYHIPLVGLADPRAIVSLIVYLAMAAHAVRHFHKGNIASWSILFFLATFSIVANLVFPIGTFMAERFMYMPSVGFCLLFAWVLGVELPAWLSASSIASRAVPLGIAALFALGFGFQTLARVPDWKDDTTLSRAAVAVSTGSARSNCFMGYSLYLDSIDEEDPARKLALLDEAATYLDRSLKIYPSYRDALNVYAGVLSSRYLIDDDIGALLNGFSEIVRNNKPPHVDEFLSWLNEQGKHRDELARFYLETGYDYYYLQRKDAAEAAKYLGFGYRVAPKDVSILETLGRFWLEGEDEPGSLKARRDASLALKYAQEGIEVDPAHEAFYEMAAVAYDRLGDPAGAARMREHATAEDSP